MNKLDILKTELFEFNILPYSETWLNQSVLTDDLVFQSFNRPERKDRVVDSIGCVMIYVKEGLHNKRRDDLEIRGIESILIEVANHNKRNFLHCVIDHQIQMRATLVIYKRKGMAKNKYNEETKL